MDSDDDDIVSIDGEGEHELKGICRPEIPDEFIEYRIQFILAHKELTLQEWKEQQTGEITAYLTEGSMWHEELPSELDPTTKITKYLIKWHGISYMHLSWETKSTLLQHVSTFKKYLKKYQDKLSEGKEIFDDLSMGEYFPAAFLQVKYTNVFVVQILSNQHSLCGEWGSRIDRSHSRVSGRLAVDVDQMATAFIRRKHVRKSG